MFTNILVYKTFLGPWKMVFKFYLNVSQCCCEWSLALHSVARQHWNTRVPLHQHVHVQTRSSGRPPQKILEFTYPVCILPLSLLCSLSCLLVSNFSVIHISVISYQIFTRLLPNCSELYAIFMVTWNNLFYALFRTCHVFYWLSYLHTLVTIWTCLARLNPVESAELWLVLTLASKIMREQSLDL